MSEPTLESIEDYNTLKGDKKRIVWTVIIAGLIVGGIYIGVNSYYGPASDEIKVQTGIPTR